MKDYLVEVTFFEQDRKDEIKVFDSNTKLSEVYDWLMQLQKDDFYGYLANYLIVRQIPK